jgi:hypothetical protein
VISEPAAAPSAPPKVHRRRFGIFYAGLVVLLAGGVATSVHLATRTVVKPVPWSSWVPLKGDTPEATVGAIALHVQNAYKDGAKKSYATVRGEPLSVGSDPAVLVKPDSTATGGYKFFEGSSVEYQICANSKAGTCAFTSNKALTPNESGAITRRMAYELALTTFHYVPEAQNVAVLLPVVQKGQKARILVLTRADNKQLGPKSLSSALTPVTVKAGAVHVSNQEATEIAKATDPLIYHYEVTATSDNQPVYLITPLLIKDTAATKTTMP